MQKRYLMATLFLLSSVACTPTDAISPQTPTDSVSPEAPSAQGGVFSYVGADADKVSSGAEVKSDGKSDLHFRFTHRFAPQSELTSLRILRVDNGVPNPRIGWYSASSSLWVMGVAVNGQMRNSSYVSTLGEFSDTVTFDLYGSEATVENEKLTSQGTKYRLEMQLAGESAPQIYDLTI